MSYPNSFDDLPNKNPGDLITASDHNLHAGAINAVETTLGLLPFGPYSDVASAIANKRDLSYAADSGSSDNYAITLSPAPTSYTAGMLVWFKANTGNTGASTLNVNSLGAKPIKKQQSLDLSPNDIVTGQIVEVVYDGTNFQLLSNLPQSTAPNYDNYIHLAQNFT